MKQIAQNSKWFVLFSMTICLSLIPMGTLMSSKGSYSLYDLILMWGAEWHVDLWKGLDVAVKTKRPYFMEVR